MPFELRPGMILGIDPTTGDLCELPAKREPEALSVVEAARRVVEEWNRNNANPRTVPGSTYHDLSYSIARLNEALERAKP